MGKIHFYNIYTLEQIDQLKQLSEEERFAIKVVANVLPFRVNNYVIEELIDWDNIPADPIYQLTFSQKNMLLPKHFKQMADVLKRNASLEEVRAVANCIRMQLNPHPDGQTTANVPLLDDEPVSGIQHKYKETCLVFPANGQTCHSYCTFCFRWPQFTTIPGLKLATDESKQFQAYLQQHQEITDVLFTGGDPLVMNARTLADYIEPLLRPEFEHIQVIRVGTKAIAYWPYRFVSDPDSDEILRLFEKVVAAGKHLAVMGHYNHWKELSTDIAQEAIRRIRSTGAAIRTQSPLLRHINDNAAVWAKLWHEQVRLGCIPYYMFIERPTGASNYFSVPLHQAWQIFQAAYKQVSGLSRTVRGPSMSGFPGKVAIEGICEILGEKVFVLTFLQARNPDWCKRPFFAKFNPTATWLTELEPAFGERFFFEPQTDLAQHSRCDYSNLEFDSYSTF